jgi:hypothetical protein
VEAGSHDPREDIAFLTFEMTMWVHGILEKHWGQAAAPGTVPYLFHPPGNLRVFTGLGITPEDVQDAERTASFDLSRADHDGLVRFCAGIDPSASPCFRSRTAWTWRHRLSLRALRPMGLTFGNRCRRELCAPECRIWQA